MSDQATTSENSSPKKIFNVLCVDGGGVRGMIPARILEEIEARTDMPIASLFDMVGGPSTGSIITSSLVTPDPKDKTKPKHTAKSTKEFYYNHCPKIFPQGGFKWVKWIRQIFTGSLYSTKPLKEVFEDAYGDARISDALTSLMVPAVDIKTFSPVWLNHFKGEEDESDANWSSMYLKDAIRASTAAPTYFPASYVSTWRNPDIKAAMMRHALIDGGVFSGNVLERMLYEARRIAGPDAEIRIVHLGTASTDNSLSPEEYNKMNLLDFFSKERGNVLTSLMMHIAMREASAMMKEKLGANYIQLDERLPYAKSADLPSISLDDSSVDNLERLERFAERVIRANHQLLNELCDDLAAGARAKAALSASAQNTPAPGPAAAAFNPAGNDNRADTPATGADLKNTGTGGSKPAPGMNSNM